MVDQEIENDELAEDLLELTEAETEYPMYTVIDVEGPELFGFYVLLICSFLIMYPIMRVLKSAFGGVLRWKQ